MKILVAEDERASLALLHKLLTLWGYEPILCKDGHSALEVLTSEAHPEMAILDWVMPGMSGPEVCKALREQVPLSGIYIILLTAKNDKNEVASGLDAGADDYVTKPINPAEFQARLRVGVRTAGLNRALRNRIAAMEELLKRYNLLGEVVCAQALPVAPPEPSIMHANASIKSPAPTSVAVVAIDKPEDECATRIKGPTMVGLHVALSKAFAQMGLPGAALMHPDGFNTIRPPTVTACASMVSPTLCEWVDLKLSMDRASCKVLFQAALKETPPNDDNELLDIVAETLNLILGQLKTDVISIDNKTFAPFIPKALIAKDLPRITESPCATTAKFIYTIQDATVIISMTAHARPIKTKKVSQIVVGDVLVEPLQSPGRPEIVLLRQGLIVDDHYLDRIRQLSQSEHSEWDTKIIQASPLAISLLEDANQ